jgi:two-component system NtrC family sensor kinase
MSDHSPSPAPSRAEFDAMREKLEVTVELCRLFARDDSEKANVTAVDMLKRYFHAEGAALFYVNGRKEFRFCLAGTEIPIGLPEARWREVVGKVRSAPAVSRFGPWALPGFGGPVAHWISSELHASAENLSFVLLGRSSPSWSEEEGDSLSSIALTIAPLVDVRREREHEEFVRHQVENLLAKNEKRLRTFFEEARDMVYSADENDVVTSLNAAGIVLTGRTEKASVVGHPFSSLVLNRDDRELFLRKIREEGFVDDYEFILTKPDGKTVFCLENASAVRGAEGRIVEIHGIVKDISVRIQNERELWKANLELAEANLKLKQTQLVMVQQEKLASIGQLAAGIAHEINPLGFLKSNQTMLEKYFLSMRKLWGEAADRSGGAALENSERLDGLDRLFLRVAGVLAESDEGFARIMAIVANLKSFSRVDRSGEFEDYDLNVGIESTLTVAWNEIKYVAEVRKELGELPPLRAKGGEINQVILNILVNAAQAIEGQKRKEKGFISIRTRAKSGHALLQITDDGPGIPEAIRNRIFDPFFTTKEPGKGTGLGLSISYDIVVAKHKGSINVEDAPGGGTIFTIELPIGGPPA